MSCAWCYLVAYPLILALAGYFLPSMKDRRVKRIIGWSIFVVTILVSTLITSDQTPLVRMVIIVFLQLLSMKVIVAIETYSSQNGLRVFQWAGFIAWFGMRPTLFEKLPSSSKPYVAFIQKGVSRIAVGLSLLYLSYLVERSLPTRHSFLPDIIMLVGLSLILHFGILNLSAALWRVLGVDVSELFRSPYRSKSLKEFWGKRWNVAFSEMTALVSYRPLKEKIGLNKALGLSFLFSGVLHEIAISIPVRAGYGLPMSYFFIQAVALHLESRSPLIGKVVRHPILSRIWVMSFLLFPMPLLFHPDFILAVLIPMRNLILQYSLGM